MCGHYVTFTPADDSNDKVETKLSDLRLKGRDKWLNTCMHEQKSQNLRIVVEFIVQPGLSVTT